MNLFLHGVEDFHIERGDTLGDPKFVQGANSSNSILFLPTLHTQLNSGIEQSGHPTSGAATSTALLLKAMPIMLFFNTSLPA